MLSHSSSNASDRLRRAKSISSAHSAASSHAYRTATRTDPFLVRQTAETAATEAYRRAHPMDIAAYPGYRPVPPRLERRKSQVTGRTEGSFLEDARLGRRRSAPRRDGRGEPIKQSTSSHQRQEVTVPVRAPQPLREDEVVVTRKRSVIPPSPEITTTSQTRSEAPPPDRQRRHTASIFQSGSPAPRPPVASAPYHSSSHTRTPQYTDKSYDEGVSVTYSAPQTYAIRTSGTPKANAPMPPTREFQTDEDIVAMARDRCLQDFQHKGVKPRKSLFFGSLQKLQKRSVTDIQQASGLQYDNSVPLFNYGDESLIAPLPPPNEADTSIVEAGLATSSGQTMRGFSGSMKGRFKKLFRKASRAPSGMPAQHVEATRLHDSILECDSPSTLPSQHSASDPFVTRGSQQTPVETLMPPPIPASVDSNRSISGDSAAAKSRVTSWTNSEVTGAASVLAEHDGPDQHGLLTRTDSAMTLRKKSSFFGRAIQNKLRKTSRAELRSSEESQALFSALQQRIQPTAHVREDAQRASSGTSETVPSPYFARGNLPSQSRATSSLATSSLRARSSTIRTVSPEPDSSKLQLMSPVAEASPDHSAEGDLADKTPTQPRRRPSKRGSSSVKPAPPPSQEQLARRMKLSQNRWQGPLDAMSPSADRPLTTAYGEENPYELPSLSRNVQLDPRRDTGGLPQHARIADYGVARREDLLSPSVYSRATNGASPRPITPDEGGTVITVTGREVRSYSISPPKRQAAQADRPVQGSGAWRKWLSDETQGFSGFGIGQDLALPTDLPGHSTTQRVDSSSDAERTSIAARPSSYRQDSATPPGGAVPRERRPRATSRRLSYMNERYPMVESSRNSSRQSGRTSRKFSLASGNEGDTIAAIAAIGGSDNSQLSVESSQAVSKRHSCAHLGRATVRNSTASTNAAPERFTMSGALPDEPDSSTATTPDTAPDIPAKSANRAKSAFDMRASYKHSTHASSRPLEVRRKSTTPGISKTAMLEDNTLRNISAGPYASQQNKENITPPPGHHQGKVDSEALPALSSSEWLAGPTSRKRNSVQAAVGAPYPAKGSAAVGRGKAGSPGQRMVTGWLERRKSRSASPAFM